MAGAQEIKIIQSMAFTGPMRFVCTILRDPPEDEGLPVIKCLTTLLTKEPMTKNIQQMFPMIIILATNEKKLFEEYRIIVQSQMIQRADAPLVPRPTSWQTSFLKENPNILVAINTYSTRPPTGLWIIFNTRIIYIGPEWTENVQELTLVRKYIYGFLDIILETIRAQGQIHHIPHEAQHLTTTTTYFHIQKRRRTYTDESR
jgi:hypothetical protein